MGAPSVTQIQTWTDLIAAEIQLDLSGFDSELSGKTNTSLWAMVDLSVDPAVVGALSVQSQGADDMSLPENYGAALPAILGRSPLRAWVTALNGLVTGTSGGAYSSLQSYLSTVAAQVHPLFAELVRSQLGESAFTSSGTLTSVFAPNYQTRAADRVYQGADGALTDITTAAANATVADMVIYTANSQSLYVGSRYKFNKLVVALSTVASVTITPTVSYWNGNAWVAVAGLVDNSAGLTKNDSVTWTLPADWVRSYKDAGGTVLADKTPLYYVKISRTAATVVTPPVGTCLRIIPAVIPLSSGSTSHLGVDQQTLAICRITAANTVVVEQGVANIDFNRFLAPAVRLRALTPISASLTPTVAYTNQAGTAASQAQAAWVSPNALDTVAVTLAGADTGARNIPTTGHSITTTATQGVFEIYAPALRTPAI